MWALICRCRSGFAYFVSPLTARPAFISAAFIFRICPSLTTLQICGSEKRPHRDRRNEAERTEAFAGLPFISHICPSDLGPRHTHRFLSMLPHICSSHPRMRASQTWPLLAIYNQKNNTQLSRHFIFHISYLHFSHEAFLNAHTSIAHAARCAVRRMPRAGANPFTQTGPFDAHREGGPTAGNRPYSRRI